MAEERIAIYVTESKIIEGDYGDFYNTISRTEAIEKMAKAMCMRAMYGCKRCVFGKDKEKCEEWIAFNHIRDAEAALDALVDK